MLKVNPLKLIKIKNNPKYSEIFFFEKMSKGILTRYWQYYRAFDQKMYLY